MRLIDADEFMQMLNEEQNELDDYYLGLGKAKSMLSDMKTIDAVLVTRCKDCVLSERVENDRTLCRLIGMKVDSNGYCECGQKMEKSETVG